jgi:cellulose synthase/poly-beta-1,6-N-acetylglucosamine synthase-like glycosyltransferase
MHARQSLLVFTDANTHFLPDTLTQLVTPFHDPRVGGVCGRLLFTDGPNKAEQDYWNWEARLKQAEAGFDSCLGANGAVYALRPECFWQDLPPQTIIDDFVLGMKTREAGLHMYYAPAAIALEDLPASRQEWHRRIRIGSGAYQAIHWCRACLHPRFGRFALFFWSHKILRWFTPHMLLGATGASIVALAVQVPAWSHTHILHLAFLSSFLLLAGMTGIDLLIPPTGHPDKPIRRSLRACSHFMIMQTALMVGFLRYCRGNLSGTWHRTPRKEQQ